MIIGYPSGERFDFNPFHDATGRFAKSAGSAWKDPETVPDGPTTVRQLGDIDGYGAKLQHYRDMHPEANSAINDYSDMYKQRDGGYLEINGALRNTLEPGQKAKANMQALDAYIQNNPLPADTMVFRGDEIHTQLKEGAFIIEPGFGSTSLDFGVASGFIDMTASDAKRQKRTPEYALYRVVLPKGTKAAPASSAEGEILVHPGATYRVRKIWESDLNRTYDEVPYKIVDLEYLGV